MKKAITTLFSLFLLFNISAQETIEELQSMYDAKASEAAALQAEADAIKSKIDAIPGGWSFSGLGVLGFDFADNSAWYALGQPYSSQNSLGLGFSALANLDEEKLFWDNGLTINMKKQNSKADNANDTETVESITDALVINSLAGYKVTEKFAISAEANFNSTVLDFGDPGQLTFSAGATWLPIQNLKIIVHPIGYQINFPTSDFTSSPGAKIGATYNRNLTDWLSWNSTLTSFLAYGGGENTIVPNAEDYSAGDLSNWTWLNGFGFKAFKGIGLGVNFGLRGDKQLADQFRTANPNAFDSKTGDNPLQFYYNFGLSYGF